MMGGLVVGFSFVVDMMAVNQGQFKEGSSGLWQNSRWKEEKLFVVAPCVDWSMGGQEGQ